MGDLMVRMTEQQFRQLDGKGRVAAEFGGRSQLPTASPDLSSAQQITACAIGFIPKRPPSVNAAYANAEQGRAKTKTYQDWQKACAATMRAAGHVPGRIVVQLAVLRFSDKRKHDIGNLEKAFSDLLVSFEVIEDDSLIEVLTIRWVDALPAEGAHAMFQVTPYVEGF